jgi:hypothetical protein
MSAVRPDSPNLPLPTRAFAPINDARAAFFQAALQKVQGTAVQAATTPSTTTRPATSDGDPVQRYARPGSLLDIRI